MRSAKMSEKVTEEWLRLGSRMTDLVNTVAEREDLMVSIYPGKTAPGRTAESAPSAWYVPNDASVNFDAAQVLDPLMHPDSVDLWDVRSQAQNIKLMGALVHECAHAAHTYLNFKPDSIAVHVRWGVLLEESRAEANLLSRRPQDRVFLRAAVIDLVAGGDLNKVHDQARGQAAHSAALILARVDTGILEEDEVAGLRKHVKNVFGEDGHDRLRAVWLKAQSLADGDLDGLVACGKEYFDIINENNAQPQPGQGGDQGEPQEKGEQSQEDGKQDKSNNSQDNKDESKDSDDKNESGESDDNSADESDSGQSGESGKSEESGNDESGESGKGEESGSGQGSDESGESGSGEQDDAEGKSDEGGKSGQGSGESQESGKGEKSDRKDQSDEDGSGADKSDDESGKGGSGKGDESDEDKSDAEGKSADKGGKSDAEGEESDEDKGSDKNDTKSENAQDGEAFQMPCGSWTSGKIDDVRSWDRGGLTDEQPANGEIQDMLDEIQDMLDEVAQDAQGEIDVAASPGRRNRAKEKREQEKEKKAKMRNQATAKRVFEGSGQGLGRGAYTANDVDIDPDEKDRRNANLLTKELRKARHRDVHRTTIPSMTPPGRMNISQAAARDAQRSRGEKITATPWRQTRRRMVDSPPIIVGLSADASGSMDAWQRAVSSFAWALGKAVQALEGKIAAVAWNDKVRVIAKPNRVSKQVRIARCGGGSYGLADSLDALDGELDLVNSEGVRVQVIITDGQIGIDGIQDRINRLNKAGVLVVWVETPSPSYFGRPFVPNGVHHMKLKNPNEFGQQIGKFLADALTKHGQSSL